MTTRRILLAISILVALIAFNVSCTDSEQEKAVQRREQIEKQETADAQVEKERQEQAEREAAPAPSSTPDEPEKTTFTYFTSNSERTAIKCTGKGSVEACGATFEDCGDVNYYCQTGVKTWSTEE